MINVKSLGKSFYDFFEKEITPLLQKKDIIFLEDHQGLSSFDDLAVKCIYDGKNKMKKIESYSLNTFRQYDVNHIFLITSIFPDNETYFELNQLADLHYDFIVHIDVDHSKEIQKELNRSSMLYMYDIPWDETTDSEISWEDRSSVANIKFYVINPQTKERIFLN